MTNTLNIKFFGPNIQKNKKIAYDNYVLLDINMQNIIIVISGCAETYMNLTPILSHIEPNWINIKCKLKYLPKFEYQDAIYENLLLLLLYGLLYLDFDNICYKDYSG